MMGAISLNALRVRRDMRLQLQMRQTELLLDAGILRAAKQLRNAEDYRGETWRPSRDRVGFDSPLVQIQVRREPGSDRARIEVVAQLGSPVEDLQQANLSSTRRSHSFSVPLPQPSQDSESSSLE
jgi:hypothetical protein